MSDHFTTLPEEILDHIFTYCGYGRCLYHLALTCRLFQRISIPYLYAEIRLSPLSKDDEPLLFHMLREPGLATLVRSLIIRDHRDYRTSAIVARLFPAMVNLQRLDTVMALPFRNLRVNKQCMIGQEPSSDPPTFAALEDVMCVDSDDRYDESPGPGPALYLAFPAIKRIFAYKTGSHDREYNEVLNGLCPGASSARYLELRNSLLSDNDARLMLGACGSLQTFIYELGYDHISNFDFNMPVIGQALQLHKHSLENLCLDHVSGMEWVYYEHDGVVLEPLIGLQNLKHLRIAIIYVFGSQDSEYPDAITRPRQRLITFLPPALEIVRFTNCHENFPALQTALEALLPRSAEVVPCLRDLTIEGRSLRYAENKEWLIGLSRLAHEQSIDMTVLASCNPYASGDDDLERKWGMGEDIEWAPIGDGRNFKPYYEVIEVP